MFLFENMCKEYIFLNFRKPNYKFSIYFLKSLIRAKSLLLGNNSRVKWKQRLSIFRIIDRINNQVAGYLSHC